LDNSAKKQTSSASLPGLAFKVFPRFGRSAFVNFSAETDPQRLSEIMQRGREDARWIIKKVSAVPSSKLLADYAGPC